MSSVPRGLVIIGKGRFSRRCHVHHCDLRTTTSTVTTPVDRVSVWLFPPGAAATSDQSDDQVHDDDRVEQQAAHLSPVGCLSSSPISGMNNNAVDTTVRYSPHCWRRSRP
jgi:hypothetical protein